MAHLIDVEQVIWIVTGVQLSAELGDRPLAYRIEREARSILANLNTPDIEQSDDPSVVTDAPARPHLTPVVISDVYYLNNPTIQHRPTISIGGPGVNGLTAILTSEVPTVVVMENALVIQMDMNFKDRRCAIWGMDHLETVRAADWFVSRNYLKSFIEAVYAEIEG